MRTKALLLGFSAFVPLSALAQEAASDAAGLQEIVVTAQKRSESANDVPLSISAFTQDTINQLGVTDVGDLEKISPGFSFTPSAYSTPIYTIRGIGFNESSIGAKPTVSVYVDEIPLPYGQLTPMAALDPERVEVLKGPQGTLFGQNSTGGAINYIAAKPTDVVTSGFQASYGRFNAVNLEGYVSGPIGDTLGVRVALRTDQGGGSQRSYTRDDKLGDANRIYGRVLLEWRPSDAAKLQFSLNYYNDESDGRAAQFKYITSLNPTNLLITAPTLFDYPVAPNNNRAADWDPDHRPSLNNRLWQASMRGDFELNDQLTITSLTTYIDYKEDRVQDPDGVVLENFSTRTRGDIRSLFQELRLTGDLDNGVRFIIGGNYSNDKVLQQDDLSYVANSNSLALSAFGGAYAGSTDVSDQRVETWAGFGNVDVEIAPGLTARAGARYTRHRINFEGCSRDTGAGDLSFLFTNFANFLRGLGGQDPITPLAPGACFTLDANNVPGTVSRHLVEDNISWRAGLDYKVTPDVLLYGTVSKGYKAGSFPLLPASVASQFTPVTQESVLAYELGFKATLFDRTMQLNGAGFYYDYRDKQIRARTAVPVFGQLERLVNVPRSRIAGAEVQLIWQPVEGLNLNSGATYVDSKVTKPTAGIFGADGQPLNIDNEPFPLTPKWQGFADLSYDTPLSESLAGFVGGTVTFKSSTNGSFGRDFRNDIDSYALIDLRAGVRDSDDRWRAWLWGRNIANKYYWTLAQRIGDTTIRFAGEPATYGVTVSFKMN